MMSSLGLPGSALSQVLQFRQLHAAEQLSVLSDFDIITELDSALSYIREYINNPEYIRSAADQRLIELVLSRITAAIRETNCIEAYAAALVCDILEPCLSHRMPKAESPHCKILLEIMLTLFWYHNKPSVMAVAIPAAIKTLSTENEEIIRRTASYLSVAARSNTHLVARFALELVIQVIKGRYELAPILPLIYSENKEPINAYLDKLISILCKPVEFSLKLSLFNLALKIAETNPDVCFHLGFDLFQLIVPHLSELDDLLLDASTCSNTLQIFLSLINTGRVACLTGQLVPLRKAAQQSSCSPHNLLTIAKILSVVAVANEQLRAVAIQDVVQCCHRLSAQHLAAGFQELETIAQSHPSALLNHLEIMREMSEKSPAAFILYNRICAAVPEGGKFNNDAVMDFNISTESLLSSRAYPSDSIRLETTFQRNLRNLAGNYQNRSASSLNGPNNRSFSSLTPSNRTLPQINENTQMSDSLGRRVSNRRSLIAPIEEPPTIQLCRDGRVRPISTVRPRVDWHAHSTTTFPVHQIPEETNEQSMDTLLEKSNDFRNDVVRQFVEHRQSKIRRYILELSCRYPIPMKCIVEGTKGTKGKLRILFGCEMRGQNCVYGDADFLFGFRTNLAPIWMHLMFLRLEAEHIRQRKTILAQDALEFRSLAKYWECLSKETTRSLPFAALVTSQFPALKEQSQILKELQKAQFFDSFSYDAEKRRWGCFSCAHPDRIMNFLKNGHTLEGRLKEKKGRWSFFRRWHTKYFTLSPASLSSSSREANQTPISLNKIRTVRSLRRYGKSRRSLPKAFEIFTEDDNRLLLKANDGPEAEKWFQCLQIAVARAHRHSNK